MSSFSGFAWMLSGSIESGDTLGSNSTSSCYERGGDLVRRLFLRPGSRRRGSRGCWTVRSGGRRPSVSEVIFDCCRRSRDHALEGVVLDHVGEGAADLVVLVLVPEVAREQVRRVGGPVIERRRGAVALAGQQVVAELEDGEVAVVVLGLEVVRAAVGVVEAAGDQQAELLVLAEPRAPGEVAVQDRVFGELVVAAGERRGDPLLARARAW